MTHRATVQHLFDRYNDHDIDAIMELIADDLAFIDHPMAVTLDRQGYRDWMAEGVVTFPDAALIDIRHIVDGDTVVSLFVEEATHGGPLPTLDGEIAATGRKVSIPICFVFEFGADGLIHAGETYYDVNTMLEQVSGS